jgi:tetratricopeptide (TPR) repeat protein
MTKRYFLSRTWCAWIGVAALAAAPVLRPDDLVRQGNTAFERGDFAAAVELYARAEERTIDPGLVAFNEATALYQLGRFRDAELHLRRCQEDAMGSRRTRLLYNLGNCLVQQAWTRSPGKLREAIQCYERCLEQDGIEAELAADTRHNLELARLLLQKARAAGESQSEANEDQGGNSAQPEDQRNEAQAGGDQNALAQPDATGKAGPALNQPGERNAAAARTDQPPPPGKGNLPPIPDEDDLAAMSREDAVEHLKQAAARIQRERQEYRQRAVPAAPANVLDW